MGAAVASMVALALLTTGGAAGASGVSPAVPRCVATGGALVRRTVAVGGTTRAYRIAVPTAPAVASSAPVLLAFHGYSSNAPALAASSRLAPTLTSRGFVVVFPEGVGSPSRWALPDRIRGADDDAFVDALLRDLAVHGCGDGARVYAAGFSNGAAFVGHLACRRPDRFRGLALVGGAGLVGPCASDRVPAATPVVLVHGRDDGTVPIGGGPVLGGALRAEPFVRAADRWQRAPGRDVIVRIVPGLGHRWPLLATEEIVATFAA